jgi:nucleotide-binding universal stress UspA family protein
MLVPLDGSEVAERVIPYVERLAAATDASVVLLQAVPTAASFASIGASPAPGVTDFVATAERIHDEADEYLATTAEMLAAQGVRTTHAVADGPPAEEILRAAEQERADLIAMTTRGRGGFERLILGSVADEVLRKALLPVFLLPVRASEEVRNE